MMAAGTAPVRAPLRAEPGFLAALEDLLVSRWHQWELPGEPSRPFDFLLLGHYEPRNKVVLCFPAGATRPAAIAKVARRPGYGASRLRREINILRDLQRIVPGTIAAEIPRPLFYGLCWGNVTGITSALSGDVLWDQVGRDFTWGTGGRVRRVLVRTASGLLPLHQATLRPRTPESLAALARPVHAARRVHRFSPVAIHLLDSVVSELAGLNPAELPTVCEHGDFWMGNTLVNGEGFGVIDWEDGEIEGIPFMDLFMLIHTSAVLRRNQERRIPRLLDAYVESHFEATWVSDVARALLAQYAASLGLTRDAAHPLFPLLLARLSTREHDALGASGTLDRFWRDAIELFAERRSQFLWLGEIPTARGELDEGALE